MAPKNIQASNYLITMNYPFYGCQLPTTPPSAFPAKNKHIFLNVILREKAEVGEGWRGSLGPETERKFGGKKLIMMETMEPIQIYKIW